MTATTATPCERYPRDLDVPAGPSGRSASSSRPGDPRSRGRTACGVICPPRTAKTSASATQSASARSASRSTGRAVRAAPPPHRRRRRPSPPRRPAARRRGPTRARRTSACGSRAPRQERARAVIVVVARGARDARHTRKHRAPARGARASGTSARRDEGGGWNAGSANDESSSRQDRPPETRARARGLLAVDARGRRPRALARPDDDRASSGGCVSPHDAASATLQVSSRRRWLHVMVMATCRGVATCHGDGSTSWWLAGSTSFKRTSSTASPQR